MDELRIILDKSVVYGLHNDEVDALDRYYFQIIPPILSNEILADLTKEAEDPKAIDRIAGNSYRISGNRGLTPDYRFLLGNSLLGHEAPMEGKYLPAGESPVQTSGGSIGMIIETALEDAMIARWERKIFSEEEKMWAKSFRRRAERPINVKMYENKIKEAGIPFTPPKNDKHLAELVDSLLNDRRLQSRLFPLLSWEHNLKFDFIDKVTKRWFREGRPMMKEFAPYAYFCLRATFLWAIGMTNPGLFAPDENDRKDLEYCYHLPYTEIFASKDRKHKRLVPFLLEDYQEFVDAIELKNDLRKLTAEWEPLSREEKIKINSERGHAPPEDENSLSFRLWKKLRGELSPPLDRAWLKVKLVDPKQPDVTFTLEDLFRAKGKELKAGRKLSNAEISKLNEIHQGEDPSTMTVFKHKLSRERALKMHPLLTEEDLDKTDPDD